MTRAEAVVDLSSIRHNLGVVHDAVGPLPVMAVVKADAYGHGMVEVAREARRCGAEWLGVALPSEARALREAGDGGRILAWLWAPGEEHLKNCLATQVDLGVSGERALAEVGEAAHRVGVCAKVHLKVDTGLSRNGAPVWEWVDLLRKAAELQERQRIDVVGCWSHLARADEPGHPSIRVQQGLFDKACAIASRAGFDIRFRHLANSAATLTEPDLHYDLVRVGIAMYGVSPTHPDAAEELGLRPAMTLRTSLARVKDIPAGQSVSYGGTFTAQRPMRIGLVPVGYADGMPRSASNRAHVTVSGQLAPVIGRVAMDQFVVGLGDEQTDAREGDEVVIFGVGGLTADDLAQASGTIGYEIVTRVGGRVPRRYVGSS